jgi:tRNA-specific 2-thiouridylase
MRVAAKLQIPFLTCDAEKAYKDDVADYFIGEYRKGKTPNPDVMCNKYVKFGAFINFAKAHGADFIATGHYAQNNDTENGHILLRGVDNSKDQSYFLWTLTQEQLSFVLLPVGDSQKSHIRSEAEQAGLITASKRDSQGICFLGEVDIPEFLSHYIELTEGAVLDECGTVIGTHKGAIVYTNGQRQGFTVTSTNNERTPYYVVKRDMHANTITVSSKKIQSEVKSILTLRDLNYITWNPCVGNTIEVQTRYHQKPTLCRITAHDGDQLVLEYTHVGEVASEGQSCVLYDGNICCGGGIIT